MQVQYTLLDHWHWDCDNVPAKKVFWLHSTLVVNLRKQAEADKAAAANARGRGKRR